MITLLYHLGKGGCIDVERAATAVGLLPGSGELAEALGVPPLPDDLLREALTHASWPNEGGGAARSNERLEFLGDAVLGMIVANALFRARPDASEGELTRMRAEVVCGPALAAAARRIGLGERLILGRGEEAAGGRDRDRNLAGGLEALLGAVYRARGLNAARALALRLLKPEFARARDGAAAFDPKSALQHLVQARWHEPPEYVTVEERGGAGDRRFVVEVRVSGGRLGRGAGPNKRAAQHEAARLACDALAEDAPPCT